MIYVRFLAKVAFVAYSAILIDPPWNFRTYSKKDVVPARGEQPYTTMKLEDIAKVPIQDFMNKDCAVFLWKSASLPLAAAYLANEWGLRIVTDDVFVWDKGSIGMGYWSRKESETVALLTKGHPRRISKGVRQMIRSKRREHSRKPDEIYSRIEALVAGPYLEMFARQAWPGWDAWGNEVSKYERT